MTGYRSRLTKILAAIIAGRIFLASILMAATLVSAPARAEQIVADISEHLIEIRSNFTGTSLLLFGAIDWSRSKIPRAQNGEPSFDVIVIVRGPDGKLLVRRKDRIAGIWVNHKSVAIDNVPRFYTVLTTRPVAEILPEALLKRHEFSLDDLKLGWPKNFSIPEQNEFREALLYTLQKDDLYVQRSGTVEILGDTLFRARVEFPSTVPVGPYLAEIYLIRDGRVIGSQTSPLAVGKEGFERSIYDFAHERPALYGLTAIILALAAGLGAGEIARRLG
jgi:uncharacterized protein (TIGR02186 family)